tara:strand:+ start:229 stop:417 length:189 start_codon:yes stop_codon:yes gene_type:complete
MASLLDIQRMGTILERKSSSERMRDRDTAGGRIKPQKSRKKIKKQKSHIDNHWEDVLRDTWS